jgi:Protein of unknown function (DUF1631)
MAPTPNSAATSSTTVPSRRELCDSLVGIVTKHANEQMTAFANRVMATLLDVTDAGLEARAVYQRIKSGNLLKNNSYAFIHLASSALEQAVRKELALLAPAAKSVQHAASGTLTLVPYEEMDNRVAFGAISQPFEISYAEQLATLNVRLGFMLERDILRIGQNPFRPEVLLMAIHQAWREFEPDQEAHPLMLPLLRPDIVFDFAPMYEALNLALMRKGVQPGSQDGAHIRKAGHASAARAARASNKAALAQQLRQFFGGNQAAEASADAASGSVFDADIPLIPDLPGLPLGNGGWRPSGAHGFGDTPHAPAQGFTPVQPGTAGLAGGFAGGPASAPASTALHPGASGPAHAPLQAGVIAAASGQGASFAHGAAASPAPAVTPLLELLARLQQGLPEPLPGAVAALGAPGPAMAHDVFYLPRLKESMPKGSLSRGDEGTIDLLSRIFETVSVDENIPQETRELIHFLQIPVLKAALLDKDFFFQEAHPARRMIDLLSRMGWEQHGGADDPVFRAMQRSVDRIGRDAAHAPAVFAEAVAELEASIESEETSTAEAISEPIARALRQEKTSTATKSARTAVALRVGSGDGLEVVDAFLENKWTAVLTVAYSVEQDKPGAVGNATKTMDELIWSVKPKVTQEQRRALIAKLPGLLAMLNKWLDVIKWQDAARLQFFAELAECHASIVRAPLDLAPERQLEIALEVAQQDAIRRIEKENAVAAQDQADAEQVDEAVITVDGLERGMWLEFTELDRSMRKVKLAWISPLRTLYIFSTGARKEAFSISSDKLAEAYREQRVRLIDSGSMVARALAQAMEHGAINDPAIALPDSAVA